MPGDEVIAGSAERCRRKADQHWDMAGEARRDGDVADEKRHTDLARRWEAAWREAVRS